MYDGFESSRNAISAQNVNDEESMNKRIIEVISRHLPETMEIMRGVSHSYSEMLMVVMKDLLPYRAEIQVFKKGGNLYTLRFVIVPFYGWDAHGEEASVDLPASMLLNDTTANLILSEMNEWAHYVLNEKHYFMPVGEGVTVDSIKKLYERDKDMDNVVNDFVNVFGKWMNEFE